MEEQAGIVRKEHGGQTELTQVDEVREDPVEKQGGVGDDQVGQLGVAGADAKEGVR